MPIYAYRCEACGFQKDALQKLSDAPLVECPSCGKPALKKQVTAAGFQLKGSGWYATDFRNNGAKPPAPAPEGDKAASGEAPATPAPASDAPAAAPASSGGDSAAPAKSSTPASTGNSASSGSAI